MGMIRGNSGEIYLDGVKIGDVNTGTIEVSDITGMVRDMGKLSSFTPINLSGNATITGWFNLHPYDLTRFSKLMHNALIKSRNERIRQRLHTFQTIRSWRETMREFHVKAQALFERYINESKG